MAHNPLFGKRLQEALRGGAPSIPTGAKIKLAAAVRAKSYDVTRWMQGRMPDMDTVKRIAKHLNVSAAWLSGVAESPRLATTSAHIPILGRATAGPLAEENPQSPATQEVSVVVAGMLITIKVRPLRG